MRRLISSLENVSVLLTSHNLTEIEELCRRVAIISNGEIRAVDTPQNLRLRHEQTQQVKITLSGVSEIFLLENFSLTLPSFAIEKQTETISLKFEREAEDVFLGETISFLTDNGARILDVETEKPTLLDVLESYE